MVIVVIWAWVIKINIIQVMSVWWQTKLKTERKKMSVGDDLAMHGRTSKGRTSTRERESGLPVVQRRDIR